MACYGFYSSTPFVRPFVLFDASIYRPRFVRASVSCPYLRPQRQPYDSASSSSSRKYQFNCEIGNFTLEELTVSVSHEDSKNVLKVEARRNTVGRSNSEEPEGFVKKFILPCECDTNQIKSELSTDGILTITASYDPRRVQRVIPILQTGEPLRRGAVQIVKANGG